MGRKKELSGMRFGKLTALEPTDERENHYVLWLCRCDCGKELAVSSKKLLRGTVTSCGCVPKKTSRNGFVAEDLTGRIFGELTALYRIKSKQGQSRWVCRCSCGKLHIASAHDLKAGKCKSCGCKHASGRKTLDLSNRTFGRLTALYPTKRRDSKGSVYWHCICECGNETEITADRLLVGSNISCGCKKKELMDTIHDQLHLVDGTCIEWLACRKTRRDNSSGFRGVIQLKNGKYRVNIGFKRKQYYVGIYKTYEEAVEARLDAERLIHDGFLKAYEAWTTQAENDANWATAHPLVFEVEKVNGTFSVKR